MSDSLQASGSHLWILMVLAMPSLISMLYGLILFYALNVSYLNARRASRKSHSSTGRFSRRFTRAQSLGYWFASSSLKSRRSKFHLAGSARSAQALKRSGTSWGRQVHARVA